MAKDYDEPRDEAEVYLKRMTSILYELDCDDTISPDEYINLLETIIDSMQVAVDGVKADLARDA